MATSSMHPAMAFEQMFAGFPPYYVSPMNYYEMTTDMQRFFRQRYEDFVTFQDNLVAPEESKQGDLAR